MMTEEEFMDAQDAYGMDAFQANIGAEAIREMGIIGLAAGSLFVFKGKLRAVLISYPQPDAKEQLIRDAMAARGQA